MKTPKRRFFATEVVQTSAMDCGPAALKSMLEGFHIPVSYGRLREACQTDVDGTSIDTLEEIAKSLGLDAEQVMLPPDHLLIPAAAALPAIIVVRLPSGVPHFVVAWQRHGGWVQLMDPASGRRWQKQEHFLHELFIHRMKVPAADWQEWARSDDFIIPLTSRLQDLGLGKLAQSLVDDAVAAPDWNALAALDAATRLTATLVRSKGLHTGREAAAVLKDIQRRAVASPDEALRYIPERYWSVRPVSPDSDTDEEEVMIKGAVLIRVRGRLAESPDTTECRTCRSPHRKITSPLARSVGTTVRRWLLVVDGFGCWHFVGGVGCHFGSAVAAWCVGIGA